MIDDHPVPSLSLLQASQSHPALAEAYDLIKIRGGLSFFEPWSYFRSAIRHVHKRNSAPIQALSAVEVQHFHRVEQKPVQEVLEELLWAGATSLGPGGSELLVDSWREEMASLRLSSRQWLSIHKIAERAGLKSQASLMVFPGITEEQIRVHFEIFRELKSLSVIEVKPFRCLGTQLEIMGNPHLLEVLATIQLIKKSFPHVMVAMNIDNLSRDMCELLQWHGVSRAMVTKDVIE
jgi:2-iminoacetate synthase ThiH